MLNKFSIIAAIATTLMFPAALSAQPGGEYGGGHHGAGPGRPGTGAAGRAVDRNVTVNRNVIVNRGGPGPGPVVGRRYHGGVWYGTGRRFWRGQWYAYGVGPCWAPSPIGYVWICG